MQKSNQMQLFAQLDEFAKPEVPGLNYLPNFINKGQEENLLQQIDKQNWLADLRRRVQHYGYKYDYKARNIDAKMKLGELPEWLQDCCNQLVTKKIFTKVPEQVIINEYLPGQGISAHIDCVPCFGGTIASLSLGSDCVMDFTNPKTGEKIPVLLEQGSLVILENQARYEWQLSLIHI
jgi:alkylated DNA repair dioxygenase AlkB